MALTAPPALQKHIRKLYANIIQKGALHDPKRFYTILQQQGKISDALSFTQFYRILSLDPNCIKFVQTRKYFTRVKLVFMEKPENVAIQG